MMQMMAEILEKMDKLMQRLNGKSKNRTRSRSRSKSRSRGDQCWYHHKFGEKANKCTQPCNFQKTGTRAARKGNCVLTPIHCRLRFKDTLLKRHSADISILPAKFKHKCAREPTSFRLQSADGSEIRVFGQTTITLNLGRF